MKKKLKLENLKVKSFVTEQQEFDSETLKGGTIVIPYLTNNCTVLNTQQCLTRFGNQCNQFTVVTCVANTIFNCDPVITQVCIVPTVIGILC